MSKVWMMLLSLGALSSGAMAQQPLPATGIQAPVPPTDVSADGRVTFRLVAPLASEVDVYMPFQPQARITLSKGADGIWTGTSAPLLPEMYSYSFLVGGGQMNAGQVEVRAAPPRLYTEQDVPHGTVALHTYASAVQGRARPMRIYLPPQYYSQPRRRFPVLYLFSGMSEEDWTRSNRAHVIYDNLIAQGKATPAIVVMPNNTTGPTPRPALENAAIMEREIKQEIVPLVERTYRTLPGRANRAIAGLSFGGGTAFTVGMRNLGLFGAVGEFGSGVFGGGERTAYAPGYADFDPDTIAPGMYAHLKAPTTRPRVFFMSVGRTDSRRESQEKARAEFQRNGIEPTFRLYDGAHEMKVFRTSLEDFAPMIFK
jgi:enterochelin esterase-like enzyme